LLTVDQLIDESPKYASKIVDVRGEIAMEYHGPVLENANGTLGVFVVLPDNIDIEIGFELQQDYLYEEYKRLYNEIGLFQKKLGEARLFATLRGKYILLSNDQEIIRPNHNNGSLVRKRFVLQRVLELDIQSAKCN
jgi:hypothetical protein